jgi:hypothetical protein
MDFMWKNAIEAYRKFVVFTDGLGKLLVEEGLSHPGSIARFAEDTTYSDPEYSYFWESPEARLPKDFDYAVWSRRPINSVSFALMLTSKEHYVAKSSAERTLRAKAIIAAIKFMSERVKRTNLCVIFTKDMKMSDVLYTLRKERTNVFVLPYTARELQQDQNARRYCNLLLHHFVSFQHLRMLHYRKLLCTNIEHYQWSNVFCHLTDVYSDDGKHHQAMDVLMRRPDVTTEHLVNRLCRLTLEEKQRLEASEIEQILFLTSRISINSEEDKISTLALNNGGDDELESASETETARSGSEEAMELKCSDLVECEQANQER